ncbi:hypothetical protein ACWGLE_01220 [Streptomyces sp. NPDC055897]
MTDRIPLDSLNSDQLDALYDERDRLRATLDDVLRHFDLKGHPGEPCLSSGWVSERTVARWRAILHPPKET